MRRGLAVGTGVGDEGGWQGVVSGEGRVARVSQSLCSCCVHEPVNTAWLPTPCMHAAWRCARGDAAQIKEPGTAQLGRHIFDARLPPPLQSIISSPPYTGTHAHTRTHMHTRTCSHTHTCLHTHKHTLCFAGGWPQGGRQHNCHGNRHDLDVQHPQRVAWQPALLGAPVQRICDFHLCPGGERGC